MLIICFILFLLIPIEILFFMEILIKKQKTINNKHISSIGRLLEIIKKYGRIE